MAQTPAKTKDHPDVQAMEQRREEQQKSNEQAMRRMEETQPTPTQEENDLAKMGVLVDDKEPDGSGPTVIGSTTVANVPLGYERQTIVDPYSEEGRAEQQRASQERNERRERSQREQNERRERNERERAEKAAAQAAKRDEAR
jgi:hypothetical protein